MRKASALAKGHSLARFPRIRFPVTSDRTGPATGRYPYVAVARQPVATALKDMEFHRNVGLPPRSVCFQGLHHWYLWIGAPRRFQALGADDHQAAGHAVTSN